MPKKKITNIKKLKITSDKILLIIFILLLILVIFLGIKVYNKKQKKYPLSPGGGGNYYRHPIISSSFNFEIQNW